MWLSDSLKFIKQFLNYIAETGFFLFVLLLNYNHHLLLDFNIDLFLYLNQFGESYPLVNVFQVLLDYNNQIFEIGLSSNIWSEQTQ